MVACWPGFDWVDFVRPNGLMTRDCTSRRHGVRDYNDVGRAKGIPKRGQRHWMDGAVGCRATR